MEYDSAANAADAIITFLRRLEKAREILTAAVSAKTDRDALLTLNESLKTDNEALRQEQNNLRVALKLAQSDYDNRLAEIEDNIKVALNNGQVKLQLMENDIAEAQARFDAVNGQVAKLRGQLG
jgi:NADH dehydrogenase/NADH:ubiquinone oxidoreductase subunit G